MFLLCRSLKERSVISDRQTSPAERRRHPRTRLEMSIRAIRLDPDRGEDMIETLRMFDISRSGMGVWTDHEMSAGQRVVLCLPLSARTGQRNLHATVVRCRPSEQGYQVGLEFDSSSIGTWCDPYAADVAA